MDQTQGSLGASRELKFHNVTILKDDSFGSGAFGVVCKAKCDGAPCAAKILRDYLCDASQPLAMKQFLQEIQLVREINHPNIVRYLGVYEDDSVSRMPILLMELLDCNLTSYLKDESVNLTYHDQLSICHDIVLALVFLHSNHIIHRDLSSNNILLTLGCHGNITVRSTKVGDFGMAKVYDVATSTPCPLSSCPGTLVYMPPEALSKPRYTEKIDCFSFGVLIVQILTRSYPNPKDQFVPINNGPTYRKVSEVERRQDHIDKIDPNNPLLSIAKACLTNNPNDRPSAQDISENIESLKSKQDVTVCDPESAIMLLKDYDVVEKTILVKHAMKVESAIKFTWSDGTKYVAPCEMSRYSNAVVNKGVVYLLPAGSAEIYAYDTTKDQWSHKSTCRYLGSSLTIINNKLMTIGGKRLDMAFRYEGAATAGYATFYTNKLWSLDIEVDSATDKWIEKLPSMPTKRAFTVALNTGANLIVAGGVGGAFLMTVEIMDIEKSQWMTATDLPQKMWGASGTLCGDSVYLLGGFGENNIDLSTVFTCSVNSLLKSCESKSLTSQFASVFTFGRSRDIAGSVWKRLADAPVTQATCVSVHDCVLAIGGRDSNGKPATDIHMYDQVTRTWIAVDHIPSARYSCFAVIHDERMLVIGGNVDKSTPTNTMNVATVRTANENIEKCT